MHILTVIGARPQFIKAAAVARALELPAYSAIRQTVVHTGQHYDRNMSARFFSELDIPEPDLNLAVRGGSHGDQTGAMMTGLEEAFERFKPDVVMVYGDTNSTLAGALVAAKAGIPLAHVEAGLRSFRVAMPEEVNRIVSDRLSTHLFCPTQTAVENLNAEGRTADVHLVGDVMYDVFLHNREKVDPRESAGRYGLSENNYVLASVHRAENTDDVGRLLAIFNALQALSEQIPVILPIHPRTRAALAAAGFFAQGAFQVVEPVAYREMVGLLSGAGVLATDSGGMQKEAYFAETPCVTLRDETEWTETLEGDWNRLAPPGQAPIAEVILTALSDAKSPQSSVLYGDGKSAHKILSIIAKAS